MDFLLDFTEAAASVPDPIVLAGHLVAATLILNPRWAYGAGVSWGLALWVLGILLDDRHGWAAGTLSAQMLGTFSGNLIGMWVMLTVVGALRAIRARRPDQRTPGDGES